MDKEEFLHDGAMKKKAAKPEQILHFLDQRSRLKRDVFELGKERFAQLKKVLEDLLGYWAVEMEKRDSRLELRFIDRNEFECALVIAGDYLLFHLHTNVFRIDEDSASFPQSAYLKENPDRAYCATIHIYNFLADSFRFERNRDVGYLVARVFVNAEKHFFAEGISSIPTIFKHFSTAELDEKAMKDLLCTCILEALNFELIAPGFEHISEIAMSDAIRSSGLTGQRTSKRMGFRFGFEREDEIGD